MCKLSRTCAAAEQTSDGGRLIERRITVVTVIITVVSALPASHSVVYNLAPGAAQFNRVKFESRPAEASDSRTTTIVHGDDDDDHGDDYDGRGDGDGNGDDDARRHIHHTAFITSHEQRVAVRAAPDELHGPVHGQPPPASPWRAGRLTASEPPALAAANRLKGRTNLRRPLAPEVADAIARRFRQSYCALASVLGMSPSIRSVRRTTSRGDRILIAEETLAGSYAPLVHMSARLAHVYDRTNWSRH